MVRVSRKLVGEVLGRYLEDKLLDAILRDLDASSEKLERSEPGMTYGEWKEHFDDRVDLVWAADTKVGFGRKGDPVYGNCDDLKIVMISVSMGKKTLHLWDDLFGDWRKEETK